MYSINILIFSEVDINGKIWCFLNRKMNLFAVKHANIIF